MKELYMYYVCCTLKSTLCLLVLEWILALSDQLGLALLSDGVEHLHGFPTHVQSFKQGCLLCERQGRIAPAPVVRFGGMRERGVPREAARRLIPGHLL